MVFNNESWNNTGEIVVYSNYHKYWLDKERQIRNPLFDVYSSKILNLKKGDESAIRYFFNLLDEEICKDVSICVVPSSNSEKVDTGLTKLGEMLAENGRKNKVHFLRRHSSIKKLSEGGFRGKSVHFNSIDANDGMTIEGDVVLLIDDVTTTGNSLYACREILFAYGADHVEMFALGKAI